MTDFWVGSYTASMGGQARGIGWAQTRDDGTLEYRGVAAEASSPSFLAHGHPNSVGAGILYAVDEAAARIEAYRVVAPGMLEPLGGQATSGAAPCHISVTQDHLYVANYVGGTADRFTLNVDGSVGELVDTLRGTGSGPHAAQEGPHLHSTLPVGESVLSADLGSDLVREQRLVGGQRDPAEATFAIDETIRPDSPSLMLVAETEFPPATGPRDLLLTDGEIFALGELSGALFRLNEHGAILASGRSVADWAPGDHAAALAAYGDWLYTGLRGSNRIAVAHRGDLAPAFSLPTGGDWPRHLIVAGETLHVANQLSSTVTSFRLDRTTGIPTPVGAPAAVPSPTYLLPA
ncbi:lactonase family protein [Lacisediminihabitans changchengi]|uniref:Beta-propeller fold lactonase family protein n=1 Tax=Lacisediminihabitans changchengi TaxID=2787634 RepID=A0A934SJU8_9MICO|nr:beta-propeller fold lactonase family protein [Lacisediminihabitans changchengi]MBK4346630.1 beta-propeller fold lactonase family protein [Lacisediminihabitans changchengi]